jgi:hypothetical protein
MRRTWRVHRTWSVSRPSGRGGTAPINWLSQLRRRYLERLNSRGPDTDTADRSTTGAVLLNDWINAYYFHDDPEREQVIHDWNYVAPELY